MAGRSLNWITDMPKRFSPADDGPLRMSLTDLSSSRRSRQSGDEGGGDSPPPSAGIQNIVRSKHQQCFVRTMQQHTWSDSGSKGGHTGNCGEGGAEVRGGDGDGGYGDGRDGGGSEAAAMMPVETAAVTQTTRREAIRFGSDAIGLENFLHWHHICNGYDRARFEPRCHISQHPWRPSQACTCTGPFRFFREKFISSNF